MKLLLQKIEYEEFEIETPFYAYVQEEEKEIFVRIDEKIFKQIIFHLSGFTEFVKFRSSGDLAEIYYKNQTTEEHWETALKSAKDFVNSF